MRVRYVVIGMRLPDAAKRHGFQFRRVAPGPDGPLWVCGRLKHWQDTLYLPTATGWLRVAGAPIELRELDAQAAESRETPEARGPSR